MATETRYGPVDSAVLEELRDSFETHRILDAVDKLDEIRYHIDSVRHELLRLHGMAHDLINDAGPNGPPPTEPIWELSDEIAMSIWQWPDYIKAVRKTLDQITSLMPDPDEELENDDE